MYTTIILPLLVFSDVCSTASISTPRQSTFDEKDIVFYLYTRNNPLAPIKLLGSSLELVNPQKPTKFIIHGFYESAEKIWYKNMTNEYLKKGDYNIIQVDWSKPAAGTYRSSTINTKDVGTAVGRLISKLHLNYSLPLERVHVIGHSLGAHVSGYAGKEVIKQTNFPISRITALDAAGPLFEGIFVVMEGLTNKDAKVVDAIHTDGGIFGCKEPVGTIDFYPNGGTALQPGCPIFKIPASTNDFTSLQVIDEVFCSHQKSYYYFISSINNDDFQSTECDSWDDFEANKCNENVKATMGDNYSDSEAGNGKFFLRTKDRPPYVYTL